MLILEIALGVVLGFAILATFKIWIKLAVVLGFIAFGLSGVACAFLWPNLTAEFGLIVMIIGIVYAVRQWYLNRSLKAS